MVTTIILVHILGVLECIIIHGWDGVWDMALVLDGSIMELDWMGFGQAGVEAGGDHSLIVPLTIGMEPVIETMDIMVQEDMPWETLFAIMFKSIVIQQIFITEEGM